MDDEEDKSETSKVSQGILRGVFGCWSGDVGKLVMVFLVAMGKECVSDGSRKCHWRIGRRTVRRCGQECSLAGVQMQVAGGERSVLPNADTFLFSSFVLTGVDETKATANGISGGVEMVATYAKRRVGRHQPKFP